MIKNKNKKREREENMPSTRRIISHGPGKKKKKLQIAIRGRRKYLEIGSQ